MKPKVTSLKGVTVKVSKAQVDIPPPPPIKTRRKRKEVPNTTPTNGKPIFRQVVTHDNPYNRPNDNKRDIGNDVNSDVKPDFTRDTTCDTTHINVHNTKFVPTNNPYNRPNENKRDLNADSKSVKISIEVKSSKINSDSDDSSKYSHIISNHDTSIIPTIKHIPKPSQPVIELPEEPVHTYGLTFDMYVRSNECSDTGNTGNNNNNNNNSIHGDICKNNVCITSSTAFLDEKTKSTNAAIENEYNNILKIHNRTEFTREPSKSLNSILHHHTHRNGSFTNTIVLRECDDTFITFRHKTVLISSTNLTKFWKVYETYKSTHNIVIDSRLQLLIMYATMAYADELLVYNAYKPKIINLYDYCSDLFKIAASELNIRQIQELFIMKMIISYYLSACGIPWQVNQIMNNLKELHRYCANGITKKSILDIMINYIRCRSVESFDRSHVSTLYELFHTYFSRRAYVYDDEICTDDVIIRKWDIKNITTEEIYLTFMLLKESNFMFVKNDDM